jgi:threonine aldolase
MAAKLAMGLRKLSIEITQPVDGNGVFAILPEAALPLLQKEYPFYVWNEKLSEVRLMCSFDTTEEEVNNFLDNVRELLKK